MTWYYRCETKGIQHWILDSNRLRDLAGGSALVETLMREAEQGVTAAGGTVIYAAAGGLLATFPERAMLEAFASEWPMYVAYHAPGLQVVQAWIDGEAVNDPVNELFTRLLPARRNLVPPPLLEAGPWLERAGRTGLPAVPPPQDVPLSKGRQGAWDEAAVEKERAKLRRVQGEFFGGSLSLNEVDEDVERWPEGPIAVVHADGSGVGARLARIGTDTTRLEAFSRALAAATRAATTAAVGVLRDQRDGPKLFIRPVVLGGDDLTVILRAIDALSFIETWLGTFERETRSSKDHIGGSGLHAGAGIAMVNRGYPFSMAYEIAEDACRTAKKIEPTGKRRDASALRFQTS
jgi:hypothetical protein